jgi:hypothetical protein
MDVELGLTRIAKALNVLGILWAALLGLAGVVGLLLFRDDEAMLFDAISLWLFAATGCGIAWTIAWILRGFAHKARRIAQRTPQ